MLKGVSLQFRKVHLSHAGDWFCMLDVIRSNSFLFTHSFIVLPALTPLYYYLCDVICTIALCCCLHIHDHPYNSVCEESVSQALYIRWKTLRQEMVIPFPKRTATAVHVTGPRKWPKKRYPMSQSAWQTNEPQQFLIRRLDLEVNFTF